MWNQLKKEAMNKLAQDPADAAFNGAICIDMAADALKKKNYKKAKSEIKKAYNYVDRILEEAKEAYGIDWLDSLSFDGTPQEDIMKDIFKEVMEKCDEKYENVDELISDLMDAKSYMKKWEGKIVGYGRKKYE